MAAQLLANQLQTNKRSGITESITFQIFMSLNPVSLVYRLTLCQLCLMFPYLALFSHASSFINGISPSRYQITRSKIASPTFY